MAKAKSTTAAPKRKRAAVAITRGPRDATVIATFATAGLTALDAGDIDSARSSLHGVITYAVGMDARSGKRDPSRRKGK